MLAPSPSVHDTFQYVGQDKVKGMLFFHAFTDCDTVSLFHNKGKGTIWQTWGRVNTGYLPFHIGGLWLRLEILEKFAVPNYDRSNTAANMDEARLVMFTTKQVWWVNLTNQSSSAPTFQAGNGPRVMGAGNPVSARSRGRCRVEMAEALWRMAGVLTPVAGASAINWISCV